MGEKKNRKKRGGEGVEGLTHTGLSGAGLVARFELIRTHIQTGGGEGEVRDQFALFVVPRKPLQMHTQQLQGTKKGRC